MAIDEKRQESRHAGVSREPGVREHVRELARISAAEGAGVQTDLVGASAVLRVAHVVSRGSVRGIDVRNLGPAGAGRTIVIDLDDNEVFENTQAFSPATSDRATHPSRSTRTMTVSRTT